MGENSLYCSAFDLDKTLLNDNSSYRFGLYLCFQGHFPIYKILFIFWCHACYLIGYYSIPKLHHEAFNYLFKGRSAALIDTWLEEFLVKYFNHLLYQPAILELRKAQEAGHQVVILSSAPDFIVAAMAKRLDVSLWECTKYAIDQNGCFSHIEKLMQGEDKALYIENLKNSNEFLIVKAYSDSYLDVCFLNAANVAIGVNPDKRLRALCKKNRWMII